MAGVSWNPEEDMILSEYLNRQVPSWADLLERLPGRSHLSASCRLLRLRHRAKTVWQVPHGNHYRQRRCG